MSESGPIEGRQRAGAPRRNWRMVEPAMALIFGMTAVAALVGVGFTVWSLVGEAPVPGWVGPVILLGSGPTTAMMGWFLFLGATPLPALHRRPFDAVVIGFSPLDTDGEFTADDPALVDVRFERDGRAVEATTVDIIPPGERGRFADGTRWSVYAFEEDNGRVILTEAHDDVARGGFNLDGIRIATESHPTNASAPGSPVLDRDFENRVGGEWI